MPKFMAVHPLPGPATVADATPIAKAVRANSTASAYWVRSWAQCTEDGRISKLFCEWNAGNAGEIRKALQGIQLPTEGIYPLMVVDSEDYR